MKDDFTHWIEETITPGDRHEILPGRRVKIAAVPNPHGLTADQAVALACRLLDCAELPVAVHFSPAREVSTNERHLLNLLSWREREAKQAKEAVAALEEQVNVAADHAQSWKNIAEQRAAQLAAVAGP